MSYKTPGVYVEEISLLPPSVAQVETAIPAFIGYTEMAEDEKGNSLLNVPTRIKSMLEYELYFGGPNTQALSVTLADAAPFTPQSVDFNGTESPYRMHPGLEMYFANGGGPCYIVSVGGYSGDPSLDTIDDYNELKGGLDAVRKIDEVTLIVFPEADRLNSTNMYDLYKDALMQCADLQDRFGIFDVLSTDTDASDFRDNIGTNNLSYGAAYYPYLNTSIVHPYSDSSVSFSHGATDAFDGITLGALKTIKAALDHLAQTTSARAQADQAVTDATGATKAEKLQHYRLALSAAEKAYKNASDAFDLVTDDSFTSTDLDDAETTLEAVKAQNISTSNTNPEIDAAISDLADSCADSEAAATAILAQINSSAETNVNASHNANIGTYFTNAFEAQVTALLGAFRMTMPPATTLAGIYAKVDNSRGVWKAPANVSVNNVAGPAVKVDNTDNDSFNVHPTGKSINVIRAFTGKGTLVWGARTLDGNSNEWRYVPVRRFFIMVEESTKKATERFVFEPNDANTWVKVKAMIENFLILQWRAGALMGAKPEEAFFVHVGLGQTMTQDDVLNGRMIVEIGMAAVRPAEFIILRFSHKMLEA